MHCCRLVPCQLATKCISNTVASCPRLLPNRVSSLHRISVVFCEYFVDKANLVRFFIQFSRYSDNSCKKYSNEELNVQGIQTATDAPSLKYLSIGLLDSVLCLLKCKFHKRISNKPICTENNCFFRWNVALQDNSRF